MATPEQRREVIVYYLGGLAAQNSDVELTINVAQRPIRLGAIGAGVRVPKYVADEMISKYNVGQKLVFSFDRNLAARAAAGENLARPKTLADYTRAELLAALAVLEEESLGSEVGAAIKAATAAVVPAATEVVVTPEMLELASIFTEEPAEVHQPIPAAVIPSQPEPRVLTPAEKAAQTRAANKAKAAAEAEKAV